MSTLLLNNSHLILLRIKILQKANEMENENQRIVLYDNIKIEIIVYTPSHFFPFQTLGYLLTSTTSACSRIILADNSPTLV